jgi:hypothetical protein
MHVFDWRRRAASLALATIGALAPGGGASAQTSISLGAGWNREGPAPSGNRYSGGVGVHASIDRTVTRRFGLRIDAMAVRFTHREALAVPEKPNTNPPTALCLLPSCAPSGPVFATSRGHVYALSLDGAVNLDSHGFLYLMGGPGLYDVRNPTAEVELGISGGAGVAAPISRHLRAFAEARWHQLLTGPPGEMHLGTVTVGVRFQPPAWPTLCWHSS